MPDSTSLVLDLVDVHGEFLKERVDIRLKNQFITHTPFFGGMDSSRSIRLGGLQGPPNGLYSIEVDAPSYRPVRRFVSLKGATPNQLRMTLPVNPAKVTSIVFPKFGELAPTARQLLKDSSSVLGFEGQKGEALYGALDNIRRAGLLNIFAKTQRTRFEDNATVLSFFQELEELRGDRFFVRVPKALREATKNSMASGLFREVNGSLHRPPDGFSAAGSFKTDDAEGNLQLTFFANAANEWVADVDIDDANGLAHAFQVLRNAITGQPTHPYDIHQILIATQELDPGYRFLLGGGGAEAMAPAAVRESVMIRKRPRRG